MSLRVSLVAAAALVGGCSPAATTTPRVRLTVKQIVERSKPAIVSIDVKSGDEERAGTGFAVDPSGVIATNLHVVSGATDIHVKTLDGAVYRVQRIVGMDEARDLALLGIQPRRPLPVLPIGDSDKVEAGDPVVAIGNPLGMLDYTVSDGLISSVRSLPQMDLTLLQISAPISQGSSGGPLFNAYGEVIGLATAILVEGQNLNFGVPSNYLRKLIDNAHPMSLETFARATDPHAEEVKIERRVPIYEVAVLDGCSDGEVAELRDSIEQTIQLGAPLYNEMSPKGFTACYRIYEGTSLEWKEKADCPGVRAAFAAGLERADSMSSDQERAWALRDTFDGLLVVIRAKIADAVP